MPRRIAEIRAGEVIWCQGHNNEHGGLRHNINDVHRHPGALDGKNVIWREPVADEQYSVRPPIDSEHNHLRKNHDQ